MSLDSVITGINFTPSTKPGNIKAFGSVTIGGIFQVNIRVLDGSKGLFIGLPGRMSEEIDSKTGKKKWYSDVYIQDTAHRQEFNDLVIAEFHKQVSTGSTKSKQPKQNFPF